MRTVLLTLTSLCVAAVAGSDVRLAVAGSAEADAWAGSVMAALHAREIPCPQPFASDSAARAHCATLALPWSDFADAWRAALRGSTPAADSYASWKRRESAKWSTWIVAGVPVEVTRETKGDGLVISVPRGFVDCATVSWPAAIELAPGGSDGITPPVPVQRTDAVLPEREIDVWLKARIVLRGVLGTDGRIDPSCIESAERASPVVIGAWLRAVSQWRFRPALKDGRAVAVHWKTIVRYNSSAREDDAADAKP
ncbi:MAG: energy transducer TonB [Acidobacteria bacterium]|nr:energy transducer TonB [Acidobacteriota bacterium]